MESIFLHNTTLSAEEFADIGPSGLCRVTEEFYINYGIQKAIKCYSTIKAEIKEKSGHHFSEVPQYWHCVDMIESLAVLLDKLSEFDIIQTNKGANASAAKATGLPAEGIIEKFKTHFGMHDLGGALSPYSLRYNELIVAKSADYESNQKQIFHFLVKCIIQNEEKKQF